jgi:hypothetical protein
MQTLPLTSDPSQRFRSSLNGVEYVFRAQWNERSGVWTLDILDGATEAPLVLGVSILIGCDMLAPFALGIGSLFALDLAASSAYATDANLDDAKVVTVGSDQYAIINRPPWSVKLPEGGILSPVPMPQMLDAGPEDLGTRVVVVFFKPGEANFI